LGGNGIGIDLSLENARSCMYAARPCIVADTNQGIPIIAGAAEAVLCSHVLEHVENPLEFLREVRRVLAPGGICFLAIPVEGASWL
jgi:SAM-dependent methyltransferase